MEYNRDAVRLVKPYVDSKVASAAAIADAALKAIFLGVDDTLPTKGSVGQLFIVAGANSGNGLYVCTVSGEGSVSATWKAVSHAD